MLKLNDFQQHFTNFLYAFDDQAEKIYQQHFPKVPREQMEIYRNVVFRQLEDRFGKVLPRTKQYVLDRLGQEGWVDIMKQCIYHDNYPSNRIADTAKIFPSLLAKKIQEDWLEELAHYEWLRLCALSKLEKNHSSNELNPIFFLHQYKYDVPRWYKKWIDSEQSSQQRKSLARVDESSEGGEQGKDTISVEILPEPPSANSNYVAVFMDQHRAVRSFVLSPDLHQVLRQMTEGQTLEAAFKTVNKESQNSNDAEQLAQLLRTHSILI